MPSVVAERKGGQHTAQLQLKIQLQRSKTLALSAFEQRSKQQMFLFVVLAADVELQFPGHGLQFIATRYLDCLRK